MCNKLPVIGKGAFTTAYRFNDRQVLLKSEDLVKLAMAQGMFPNSKLFPEIDFLNSIKYKDYDYIMNYEPDLKSRVVIPKLNPYYQNMYRQLKKLENSFHGKKDFEKNVDKLKGIKTYHKNALKSAFAGIMNFEEDTDIRFEISPRNVSTKNGRLILNDCFFLFSAMLEKLGR